VVTVTGTRAGSPGIRAGTCTVQTCIRGQLTDARVGPNITVIRPLGLKRPEPVRVITVPGRPDVGVILSCEGGPAVPAGGGPTTGAREAPGRDGAVASGLELVGEAVVGGAVVGDAVVGGRVRTVEGGTVRTMVGAVEV
jgi:hypothetical protein